MAGEQKLKSQQPPARQPGGRPTPVLVPQGALAGQPDVPLDRPVTTVGSNDSARLHLVSRTVSKGHALFVNSGGVTYVADLASRTGVLVNGKLIRDTDLKTGDRVQIGKFIFRYRSPANFAPPPPASIPPVASVIVVGTPAKPIEGRVFQIGRRENSDVSFPTDAAVSAGHAVIFEMNGNWYLRDLGSRTGTTVNGKAIHQHPLKFGDRIAIGSATILFQPGAVEVEEPEMTEPDITEADAAEPDIREWSVQPETPAAAIAPLPIAGDEEEAIPLADEPIAAHPTQPPAEPEPVEHELAEQLPVELETIELETAADSPRQEPAPSIFAEAPAPVIPEPHDETPLVAPVTEETARAETATPQTIVADEISKPPFDSTVVDLEPVAELISPVEDFVFVPGPEANEASALPDLIFWGDDEPSPTARLESAAPQADSAAESPIETPDPAQPASIFDSLIASNLAPNTAPNRPSEPSAPSDVVSDPLPIEEIVSPPVTEATNDAATDFVPEVAVLDKPLSEPFAEAAQPSPVEPVPDEVEAAQAVELEPVALETPPQATGVEEPLSPAHAEISDEFAVEPITELDAPHEPVSEPVAEVEQPNPTEVLAYEEVESAHAVDLEPIALEPSPEPIEIEEPITKAVQSTPVELAVHEEVGAVPLLDLEPAHESLPETIAIQEPISPATAETPVEPLPETSAPYHLPAEPVTDVEDAANQPGSEAMAIGPSDEDSGSPRNEAFGLTLAGELPPELAPELPDDEMLDLSQLSDLSNLPLSSSSQEPSPAPATDQHHLLVEPEQLSEEFLLLDEQPPEPETTQSPADMDLSGISTANHPPAEDSLTFTDGLELAPQGLAEDSTDELTEEPIGFEPVESPFDDLPSLEVSPAEETSQLSGSSTVDALPPEEHLNFTQPVAEAEIPDIASDVPAEPIEEIPGEDAAAPQAPPPGGPSIFGFQFEGGSFLGGMPISLKGKAPVEPPAPAAPPAATPPSPVFDASTTPPTGLGGMLAAGPALPTAPPLRPPARPTTPPRPTRKPIEAPAATAALPGLVSDAHLPWAASPVIPPVVAKMAGAARTGLSSNFADSAQAPRVAEVFSQMSAPIGVEVFGGAAGDPNQFNVPDSKPGQNAVISVDQPVGADSESALTAPRAGDGSGELAGRSAGKITALPPIKAQRKSRLPLLLALCVLIPSVAVGLIYKLVPISARVQGSLPFDGLLLQQPDDVHDFHQSQEQLLMSNDVRLGAQTILKNQNLPLGFTADPDTYQSAVASQNLNWKTDGNFQLIGDSTNESLISQQVKAVLTALAEKDRDLDAARNRARVDAAIAKQALNQSAANVEAIVKKRREMDDKASDYPDPITVSRADQERDTLVQQWKNARTLRENSEKVLADLRSQNPAAPLDPNADPDVKALQAQLQPLLDQIAKLRGTGSVDASTRTVAGSDIALGATTQPDTDPLIVPLQQQADLIAKKLVARRADLATLAAVSPEQRAVDQSRAIEDLSVKITTLQNLENQAKTAADDAAAKASALDAKVAAASIAAAQAQELEVTQHNAEAEQKRASEDSEAKEAALARCVTVHGLPSVVTLSTTDLRPKFAGASAVLAWLVLGALIAGELRRPKLMTSPVPAAAPRVNPPVTRVPWPQPKELAGLDRCAPQNAPAPGEIEQPLSV